MTMTSGLSWALVIATYGREKILPMMLDLAVRQSRPPKEIIIVDASENWETTRDRVLSDIAVHRPEIRWVYVAAEHRSITLQRNQGIPLATADILFLIDDDSMMYSDCAERIMEIYEADPEHRVMGVQSNFVDKFPPIPGSVEDDRQKAGISERLLSPSVQRFLWRSGFLQRLLVLDTKEHFIPYDGYFEDHSLPEAVKRLNVTPTRIFDGFRMTYRREVFEKETFEPLFFYYAVAEDSDLSYRASRHGALVMAVDARLHHFQSGAGRIPSVKVSALAGLNTALCLRKHSNNLSRDRSRFYRFMLHLMFAQGVKDLANRRWSLPRARGLMLAISYAPKLFSMSREDLAEWYPGLQHKLINS